jgi:hypothetical protein
MRKHTAEQKRTTRRVACQSQLSSCHLPCRFSYCQLAAAARASERTLHLVLIQHRRAGIESHGAPQEVFGALSPGPPFPTVSGYVPIEADNSGRRCINEFQVLTEQ